MLCALTGACTGQVSPSDRRRVGSRQYVTTGGSSGTGGSHREAPRRRRRGDDGAAREGQSPESSGGTVERRRLASTHRVGVRQQHARSAGPRRAARAGRGRHAHRRLRDGGRFVRLRLAGWRRAVRNDPRQRDRLRVATRRGRRPSWRACRRRPTDTACLTQAINAFGRRAFRRPLTSADETTLFLNMATTIGNQAGSSALTGRSLRRQGDPAVARLSLSRRAGRPSAADGGRLKYTSFEMASRLAATLWASVPDDAVLDAAAQDTLVDAGRRRRAGAADARRPARHRSVCGVRRPALRRLRPGPGGQGRDDVPGVHADAAERRC